MIVDYIQAALKRVKYEIIDDEEPFYGEIPQLNGVWASGNSLEHCREMLVEVLEGWILMRIRKGKEIPKLDNYYIKLPEEITLSE